ncbi:Translin-like protein [Globisporangium polare]
MSALVNNAAAGSKGRRAVDSCRDEFTLVVEGGKPKMQCNHCGVAITNHTATLKNHLARKHGGNGGEAGGNGDAKANVVAGPATAEEEDGEEDGDVVEEQVVDKSRVDKTHGKQVGGDAAAVAVALSTVAQQAPPTTAVDVKKEAKKRSQRSTSDKDGHSNGDTEREDAEQTLPDKAEAQEGADKKRRLEDAAKEVETPARTVGQPEVLPLVDHQDFADMNREMHEYDEVREQIIKRSREILKCSKQAIFALHRNDHKGATDLLVKAEKVIPELFALAKEKPALRDGALSAALEEYVEAKSFSYYLEYHRLLPLRDLPNVQKSEYIGGIIDLTGELMRYAVVKATARDVAEVERCRSMVEAISGELIQFDFRNGPLRKKYDSVKYNLRKLENTLYELSLITNSGLTIRSEAVQDEPPRAEEV